MVDAHFSHQGSMWILQTARGPEAPQSWERSPTSPLAQTLERWDHWGSRRLAAPPTPHLLLVPVDAPEPTSPGRRWAWRGASQCSQNEGIMCRAGTTRPPSGPKQTRTPQ